MPVPAGLIVGWPSTVATIPAGWTRVTALDSKYMRSSPLASDTLPAGGAASHTHLSTSHTHPLVNHSHPGSTSASVASNITRSNSGQLTAAPGHGHTVPESGVGVGTVNPTVATWGTTTNEPAFLRVIFIQSDGTTNGIPDGAILFWNGSAVPSGWSQHTAADDKFLRGATPGAGGGATGGSNLHQHTANTHLHVMNPHAHAGGTSGSASPPATGGVGGLSPIQAASHVHEVTLNTAVSPTNSASVLSSPTGIIDRDPPFLKLLTIRNTSGGNRYPIGMIVAWRGLLANIPAGWIRCDGSNGTVDLRSLFVKAAASPSQAKDGGGSNKHQHGLPSLHEHSVAHAHTFEFAASAAVTSYAGDITGGVTVSHQTGHNIASPNAGGNSQGSIQDVLTPEDPGEAYFPEYNTVHYIQLVNSVPEGSIAAWPGTVAAIPVGWLRETSLDSKFIKSIEEPIDPGTVSGFDTHIHSVATHTHTLPVHTHGGTTAASIGGAVPVGNGASSIAVAGHTHAHTSSSASSGVSSSNVAAMASASNIPPYFQVIFIRSDGTPIGIPVGCLAFWHGAALPTDWILNATAKTRFLRGAPTGQNGGSTGGTTAHTHAGSSHVHTISAHAHANATSGTNNTAVAGAFNGGAITQPVDPSHTHTVAYNSALASQDMSGTEGTSGSTDHIPVNREIGIVENQGSIPDLPEGIILAWLGLRSQINVNWSLCNGTNGTPDLSGKYLRGANIVGDIGIDGGEIGHNHSSTGHTHLFQHTHAGTVTGGAASVPGEGGGTPGNSSHGHPVANTATTSVTNTGSASPAIEDQDHGPVHVDVAFIQYTPVVFESSLYGGVPMIVG